MTPEQKKRLAEIRKMVEGCGAYQCCKETLDAVAIVDAQAQRLIGLEEALREVVLRYPEAMQSPRGVPGLMLQEAVKDAEKILASQEPGGGT